MFIVIEIQTDSNNNVGTLVNSYNNQADAESKYHDILSSAAISQLKTHSAIILTEEAFELKHECYKHNAGVNVQTVQTETE
mgnify:CR=1 FL=1